MDRRQQVAGQQLFTTLEVEPMAIKDIKVVETIKEGTTIYTRP
jgi:predicted amidohydrolase YtcJ